jgi:NitT/TauT family transport system permease protein
MTFVKKALYTVVGLAILFAGWQALSASGRYNSSLFPSPIAVIKAIKEVSANGQLIENLAVSLARFSAGYISAVASGIILGILFGWFTTAWKLFDPVVQLLRPVSPIAWIPFMVLWFGIGNTPAVIIIFLAGFFPVLLSTVGAMKKIDPVYLKVARDFNMKTPAILVKIIFPAAFPFITSGIHIALGSCWVFLVAGEMVGAQSGLGFMIIDARNAVRSDLLMAAILLIGVTGLLLNAVIKAIERIIEKKWGRLQDEY